jgi:hypothetical protein
MALTSVAQTVRGNMKVSIGTLSGGDDTFTFDSKMVQWWIATPAAAVLMVPASASAGNAGFNWALASTFGPFHHMDMAGRIVTLVGTNTQIVRIMESLRGNPTA